ncbi:SDR family NAD(P)-dependent oxidoreductase [Rhizobium skierniewicense]|nr:SDR family NAD(P)-dependent oxidoreductase [Rhizobium skierniewicense]
MAITGASCRVPGASTLREFWSLISEGRVAIERFTLDAARRDGVDEDLLKHPGFIAAGGIIDGINTFDASFFDIAPSHAAAMDPQHRIFLECVHEALENAGYGDLSGPRVGVWAGSATVDYLADHIRPKLDRTAPNRYLQQWVGADKDYLATQVAYRLDFGGPAISVQTACSTSLVAVVQAVQALLSFQCDFAVAGGVSVGLPQKQGHIYEEGSILSADGRCLPFTTESSGTIFGNGAGVVLLRRLEDAVESGDHIIAVIRGGAINNDGAAKVGFTAPGGRGQAEVIRTALDLGEVEGATIGYVETHGTGTAIGDAIELSALTTALGQRYSDSLPCAIGSVKANIGHLNAAAGVCGLIKTALALQHNQIPPAVGADQAIDELREPSGYFLPAHSTAWPSSTRRAGVSSFGVGGTNAHVILEAAPVRAQKTSRGVPLLLLSARDAVALRALCADYAAFLADNPNVLLEDVCFTAARGRRHWDHRAAFPAHSLQDLIGSLTNFSAGHRVENVIAGQVSSRPPEVAIAFGDGQDISTMLDDFDTWRGRGVSPAMVCGTGMGLFAAACAAGSLTVEDAVDRTAENVKTPSLLWIDAASSGMIDTVPRARRAFEECTVSDYSPLTALENVGATFVIEFGRDSQRADLPHALSLDPHSHATIARLWVAGAEMDLRNVFSDGSRIQLPTYPFQREIFWIERGQRVTEKVASAFLGRRTEAPAVEATLFDANWSVASLPFLKDHVIYGKIVVSGAALAVMIAEGVRELSGSEHCVLSNVQFPAALIIAEGTDRRVQLQLVRTGNGFEATVLTPDGFEIHATARVETSVSECMPSPVEVQGEDISPDLLASWLRDRQVVMGPTFRRLSNIVVNEGEASARMGTDGEDAAWLLHPGLLDSALQLVAAAARPEGNRAFVPTYIDRIVFRQRPGSELRCYASVHRGFASVFDQDGVVIEFSGLESREVGRNELLRIEPVRKGYSVEWSEIPGDGTFAMPTTVVLIRDNVGHAEQLAEILQAEGKRTTIVARADVVPFDNAEIIIDCRGMDALSPSPDLPLYQGAIELFAGAARRDDPCAIAIVMSPDTPSSAPLQALARAAAMETPQLRTLSIHANSAPAIRRALDYFDQETEVSVHGEIVHAPRFSEISLSRRTDLVLSGDVTWVVTGGLGELGLRVATWLAAMGVAKLVLVGRQAPHGSAEEALASMRRDGVDVRTMQADLSVKAQVDDLFDRIEATMPPVKGIVHLAGIVEDRLVSDVTRDSLEATFAGKASGAWFLHERTSQSDLDYFVLFSSAAAAFGAPGQTTYAMANTYLDALAIHRRSLRLPSLSLAWGPWQDIGMAARTAVTAKRRLSLLGIGQLEEDVGRATFENLMAMTTLPRHLVLLPVEWQQLVAHWPAHVPLSRFENVATLDQDAKPSASIDELFALPEGERRGQLLTFIAEDASAVTGAGIETLDPERSLFDYDLDSLLITDLRARLEQRFCFTIPTTVIFSNPTINMLVDHIAQVIFHETSAHNNAADMAAVASHPGSSDKKEMVETKEMGSLSQEEVVELLSAKLNEIRGTDSQ